MLGDGIQLNKRLLEQINPSLLKAVKKAGIYRVESRFLFSIIDDLVRKHKIALMRKFRLEVIKKWKALEDCPGFERRKDAI